MNYIAFKLKICRLDGLLVSTRKECNEAMQKAMKESGKKGEDLSLVRQQYLHDMGEIEDGIRELWQERLSSILNRLKIPHPSLGDNSMWADNYFGMPIWTDRAIYEMQKTIRRERHERAEMFFKWVTALTGLGGVAIGVIAIIKG